MEPVVVVVVVVAQLAGRTDCSRHGVADGRASSTVGATAELCAFPDNQHSHYECQPDLREAASF